MQPATLAWLEALNEVYNDGEEYAPRGMRTKELLSFTSAIDMRFPVVHIPERKLGFKFMSAEAAWILSGDNRVETIKPFSRDIVNFSDDGVFFHGAYGPQVIEQLSYICRILSEDQDTRQAVMTIWRKNPGQTKDVPCTVSVQWLIRDGMLHCVDSMRSSDLWLGWPYDVFNFSMLSYYIRSFLQHYLKIEVEIGNLYLVAGSQHIYERNFKDVEEIVHEYLGEDTFTTPPEAVDVTRQLYPLTPNELVDRLWEVSRDGQGALDLIGA